MQPRRTNGRRLGEEENAENDGADRADAGPDGIGRAERQGSDRQTKQGDAKDHRTDGQDRRRQPRETVGVFETDCPADFEDTGKQED